MSQYPPPPDPQHYTPIYPAASAAQHASQLLDSAQQDQLQQFAASVTASPAAPSLYAKIEPSLQDQHSGANYSASNGAGIGGVPGGEPQITPLTPTEAQQKANRLRKACDSCSIRKVKCDESGPPCRACAALDIPCTFERPSRRRGPPNRHAERMKRAKLGHSPADISGQSAPSSPTNAAHALASLSTQPTTLSAESICPLDTVELLVNDFFTYIHPLCPFPHEPWFRQAFNIREDCSNRSFLALLSSMIGCLVASFPRKPRLHLKAQRREQLFPTHMAMVNRCQQICAAARGTGYLEKEDLSVYDAATSYFLGLIGAYTFRWRQMRLYFGECLTIIRSLGLHKAKEQMYTELGNYPGYMGSNGVHSEGSKDGQYDIITQEMGRRLYWTCYVGMRTLQQLGVPFNELVMLPATPSEPSPPLPLEIDDVHIFPDHIREDLQLVPSLMAGFNANVRVFRAVETLATVEMAYGINEVFDWERQKKILQQCLQKCKSSIDGLPIELTVRPQSGHFGQPPQTSQPYYPPMPEFQSARTNNFLNPYGMEDTAEGRRHVQFEIQKANIYASYLSTRSYIVEKFWNQHDARMKLQSSQSPSNSSHSSPSALASGLDNMLKDQGPTSGSMAIEQQMADEREEIIKDLCIVLGSINQVNMEPNADSFTTKIRQIVSTLLDVPRNRKGTIAMKADQYIRHFVEILAKLERVSTSSGEPTVPEDEESDIKHWVDLRAAQEKFQQEGGMFGS